MTIEKIKLLFAKSKSLRIVVVLVLVGGLLCFGTYLYDSFDIHFSEMTKGVAGTLLGAIVGGSFTLIGSLAINKSTQKAVNAVKRKNVIYKPLYDELMDIHADILKENPYPSYIVFEKGQQTITRHPQYTVWGRIRKDARIFEIPEKLKNAMEKLYETLEVYQEKYKNAATAFEQIYREELKKISNKQISDAAYVSSSLLSYVLSGNRPDNGTLMWFSDSVGDEEADALWESLQRSVRCEVELRHCVEARESWDKAETNALKLLGFYIQYITARYER